MVIVTDVTSDMRISERQKCDVKVAIALKASWVGFPSGQMGFEQPNWNPEL